jgi:hypothetical protein
VADFSCQHNPSGGVDKFHVIGILLTEHQRTLSHNGDQLRDIIMYVRSLWSPFVCKTQSRLWTQVIRIHVNHMLTIDVGKKSNSTRR